MIVDAPDIALRPVAPGWIFARIANLGIATLRARAVDIHNGGAILRLPAAALRALTLLHGLSPLHTLSLLLHSGTEALTLLHGLSLLHALSLLPHSGTEALTLLLHSGSETLALLHALAPLHTLALPLLSAASLLPAHGRPLGRRHLGRRAQGLAEIDDHRVRSGRAPRQKRG